MLQILKLLIFPNVWGVKSRQNQILCLKPPPRFAFAFALFSNKQLASPFKLLPWSFHKSLPSLLLLILITVIKVRFGFPRWVWLRLSFSTFGLRRTFWITIYLNILLREDPAHGSLKAVLWRRSRSFSFSQVYQQQVCSWRPPEKKNAWPPHSPRTSLEWELR